MRVMLKFTHLDLAFQPCHNFSSLAATPASFSTQFLREKTLPPPGEPGDRGWGFTDQAPICSLVSSAIQFLPAGHELSHQSTVLSHIYGQLIFDNDNNTRIHNGKRTVSLISSVGKPGYPHAKKKKKKEI